MYWLMWINLGFQEWLDPGAQTSPSLLWLSSSCSSAFPCILNLNVLRRPSADQHISLWVSSPWRVTILQQLQQKSRDQLWLVQTRSQVCHQANHSDLSDRLYKMRDKSESCMKRLARIWEWEILTAITERKNRLKLQLSLHWIPALPCLCAPGQAIASLWPLSSSPVKPGH